MSTGQELNLLRNARSLEEFEEIYDHLQDDWKPVDYDQVDETTTEEE